MHTAVPETFPNTFKTEGASVKFAQPIRIIRTISGKQIRLKLSGMNFNSFKTNLMMKHTVNGAPAIASLQLDLCRKVTWILSFEAFQIVSCKSTIHIPFYNYEFVVLAFLYRGSIMIWYDIMIILIFLKFKCKQRKLGSTTKACCVWAHTDAIMSRLLGVANSV